LSTDPQLGLCPVGNRDVIHKSTGTRALTGSLPPTNCPEEPDLLVPPKYGKEYEAAAQLAGDKIEKIEDAGHFEVIAPNSIAWPTVERAVQSLVKVTR
jgi:hypothetical protein